MLERSCYLKLKKLKEESRILFFLRQIPFDLPGGMRHVVDFCVFLKDEVKFLEAKGRDLAIGKLKRLQVEDIYNIPIEIVKNSNEIEAKLFT